MPLLIDIFEQGIREGVLNIPFPDQIGAIFVSLLQSLGDAFAELLLADEPLGDELRRAERVAAAYADVIERVLGAPAGSIKLIDAEALHEWFVSSVDDAS